MKIHVGTRNTLKVRAAHAAFAAVFADEPLDVVAVSIEGGVPPQPFDDEVVQGAIYRARGALAEADYGVGIEAGLVRFPGYDGYLSVQFCAVLDCTGRLTVGHGPGYALPQEVLDRLMNGSTLNCEMSRLSGIPEIKEKEGAIGVLSGGRIDRFSITREAVLMALIPRI
ncbi:MAG: inosine/xanthosine triphosphatase, partial [Candidatus Bipolaricaulota bacterium]|nr:inosine/xanthosine triphosphatase [Candidatus Bipolaricaulota bacterium]